MLTAVDSNILIDIFGADPKFGESSADLLRKCIKQGAIYACEVVFTEVAATFPNQKTFINAMETLGIEFNAMTKESALLAAHAWEQYRKMGGKRERVAADFLIGAHAKLQSSRLLTRDKGFYRMYFRTLTILDPQK